MKVSNVKIGNIGSNSFSLISQLKEKVLSIQRIKSSLGIENLAASLGTIKPGVSPAWQNFLLILEQLYEERYCSWDKTDNALINRLAYEMATLAGKLKPGEIHMPWVHKSLWVDIGTLFELVQGIPSSYGFARYLFITYHIDPPENAMINAAFTFRMLFEKADNYSYCNESEIRKMFFRRDDSTDFRQTIQKVREQAVLLVENTYKRGWRKDIKATGLIPAFKFEENDSLRARIAMVIAKADPKSILGEEDIREARFHPLDRLFNNRNLEERYALLYGVEQLCLVQQQKGQYYNDFSEVPELNPQERIQCLSSAIRVLEQLSGSSFLEGRMINMLNSCGNVISYLLSDESIEYVKSKGQRDQYDEFENLISGSFNLNLVKLIDISIQTAFKNPNWDKFHVIDAVCQIVDRSIYSRQKLLKEPLAYYLDLRKNVVQIIMQSRSDYITNRLKLVVDTIDTAVEEHLTSRKDLSGAVEEFNKTLSGLLDILESSRRDPSRFVILSILGSFLEKGLVLNKSERVPMEKIFSVENLERFKKILINIVHGGNLTKPLFLNPQSDSLRGKALLLYRKLPKIKSYKDYFGMKALKAKASKDIVEMITSNSSSRCMLLSGLRGTGKSMFAIVLANEFAIPLKTIAGSGIKECEGGGITIQNERDVFVSEEKCLEDISKLSPCVVVIDEIDKVAPASAQSLGFIDFLERLKTLNIMVIGTTNFPLHEEIDGMKIDTNGNSKEIDEVLARYVHKDCLKYFETSYYFQDDTVGSSFTSEYLKHLIMLQQINESINVSLISCFGRGLTPFDLKSAIDESSTSSRKGELQVSLLSVLGRMQLGRYKILTQAKRLEMLFKNLDYEDQVRLRGTIDYRMFAFLTLDVPFTELEPLILDWMKKLNEGRLFNLFSECLKCDTEVIEVLKKL